MSSCSRCGAVFTCAMANGTPGADAAPCWCLSLPPVVAVPAAGLAAACWCPACLRDHIAEMDSPVESPPSLKSDQRLV